MTDKPKKDLDKTPLKGPVEISSFGDLKISPIVKEVIGLAYNYYEGELLVHGLRWPSKSGFFPKTEADFKSCIATMQNPGSLKNFLQEKDLPNSPMNISVYNPTLFFFTSNIKNIEFRENDEIIAQKIVNRGGVPSKEPMDRFFVPGSVQWSNDLRTVFWTSNFSPSLLNDPNEPEKFQFDIYLNTHQERNGSPLKLPIILDPGTNNGGGDGWPPTGP